jgi:AcrR family transcriptional regulator
MAPVKIAHSFCWLIEGSCLLPSRLAKKLLNRSGPLTAIDWIKAALVTLAEQGIDGVRVEPLAKRLGVTKGSFYWHFKDRAALTDALLKAWSKRIGEAVAERLEQTDRSPRQELHAVLRLPFERSVSGADIDYAIRLWSRRDPKAKTALAKMDEVRLRQFSKLLIEIGVPAKEARARAILAYSYMRMAMSLPVKGDDRVHAVIEDILLRR